MNKPGKKPPEVKRQLSNPLKDFNSRFSDPSPRNGIPTKLAPKPSSALKPTTISSKNPSKSSLHRPKPSRPSKPQKPLISTPSLPRNEENFNSKCGVKDREMNLGSRLPIGFEGNGSKVSPCLDSSPVRLRRGTGFRRGHSPAYATFPQTTPEKGEKEDSVTRKTTTTPPIHASVSPEIMCAPSLLPTPPCFAAGHRAAGIPDRRKCKPRGILKVGDGSSDLLDPSSENLSVVKASMQWVSVTPQLGDSSSENSVVESADFTAGSPKWLLPCYTSAKMSPISGTSPWSGCANDAVDDRRTPTSNSSTSPFSMITKKATSSLKTKELPSHKDVGGYGYNYTFSNSPIQEESWSNGNVTYTPSSVSCSLKQAKSSFSHESYNVAEAINDRRTPSSNSSTSPFSMILKRATVSSGFKAVISHKEIEGHGYNSTFANSSIWSDSNAICTPLLDACSMKEVRSSSVNEEDNAGDIQIIRSTSPEIRKLKDPRSSHGHSFRFDCVSAASESIDLTQFHRSLYRKAPATQLFHMQKENSSDSEGRISWREGLVSRIFEMHELDNCLNLSDGDKILNHPEESLLKPMQDIQVDPSEQRVPYGFGSFEHLSCEPVCHKSSYKLIKDTKPMPCSESVSIDADRLVSSSDSNWRILFKNDLFGH